MATPASSRWLSAGAFVEFGFGAPPATNTASVDAAPPRAIFDDAPDGAHAVFPVDLLALCVRAARVRDADFVDTAVESRDLCGDFRLEAKPILLDADALDDLAAEDLVTGLHVGEVQVREGIRHERQEPIAEVVPEIQDPVRVASDKS